MRNLTGSCRNLCIQVMRNPRNGEHQNNGSDAMARRILTWSQVASRVSSMSFTRRRQMDVMVSPMRSSTYSAPATGRS